MQKRFDVVIVGGGTAGWMTAAYLRKALSDNIQITLLESPTINTVGVGEATFSTARLFFDNIGVSEEEWMPACNASYKLAIKFAAWNPAVKHFYHPFQRFETVRGLALSEWWLKLKQPTEAFDYACFTVPHLCDAKSSPRFPNGETFDGNFNQTVKCCNRTEGAFLSNHQLQNPYGYHFDASLLAKFLSDHARGRGVKRVCETLRNVNLTNEGCISSVGTEGGMTIPGDLFIDCTGFRSLLLTNTLHEPFINFSDSLFCDSAVAMQIPTESDKEGIDPYTTATALSAGWVWNIPLFQRIGTGYVYCSGFLSPCEAEDELRNYLGIRAQKCSALHIKMRVGRALNSWVKNCVAIGLSSGFVEPLESTGIFFIQHAIEELVNYFPSRRIEEEAVASYNTVIGNCIDGVRDFLVLHYVASPRTDTAFWKASKYDASVPDELGERLKLWKYRLPTSKTISPHYHGFEAYSYTVMLLGLGHTPEMNLPVLDVLASPNANETFAKIRDRSRHLQETLPSQYSYLAALYGNS